MSSSIAAPPVNGNVVAPTPARRSVVSAPSVTAPVAAYFSRLIFSVPLPVAPIALGPAAPSVTVASRNSVAPSENAMEVLARLLENEPTISLVPLPFTATDGIAKSPFVSEMSAPSTNSRTGARCAASSVLTHRTPEAPFG